MRGTENSSCQLKAKCLLSAKFDSAAVISSSISKVGMKSSQDLSISCVVQICLPKELALIFLTTRISWPWACTLNTSSFSLMSIFMFYEHNPNSAGSSQLLLANGGVVTPSASALHLHLWGWCILVWHVMFLSALVNMMLHVVKPSDQVMSPFVIVKNLWAIIFVTFFSKLLFICPSPKSHTF